MKRLILPVLVCALAAAAALSTPSGRALIFSDGLMPETRGLAVARAHGCFTCHGSGAGGGVANPGAGTIPSLTDFAFLMSVHSDTELRAWILDGAPASVREAEDFEAGKQKRAVSMPAYRGKLSDRAFADLLAWYHAVAGTLYPREPAAAEGLRVAEEKGCFSCHGPAGRFDTPNPGSLVGRIPAWHSPDFAELVANEDELRTWILDGGIDRLQQHPVAGRFLARQTLQMPAYRDKITEDELDALTAYITWLRDPTRPGHTPRYEDPRPEETQPTFY